MEVWPQIVPGNAGGPLIAGGGRGALNVKKIVRLDQVSSVLINLGHQRPRRKTISVRGPGDRGNGAADTFGEGRSAVAFDLQKIG